MPPATSPQSIFRIASEQEHIESRALLLLMTTLSPKLPLNVHSTKLIHPASLISFVIVHILLFSIVFLNYSGLTRGMIPIQF